MDKLILWSVYYLSYFLATHSKYESFFYTFDFLDKDIDYDEMMASLEEVKNELLNEESEKEGIFFRRLYCYDDSQEVGTLAVLVFSLALLANFYPAIRSLYNALSKNKYGNSTLGLAAILLWEPEECITKFAEISRAYKVLDIILKHNDVENVSDVSYVVDKRLLSFLADRGSAEELSDQYVRNFDSSDLDNGLDLEERFYAKEESALVQEYHSYCENIVDENPVIFLTGKTGSGRTYLAKSVAKDLDKTLILVDLTYFSIGDGLMTNLRMVLREMYFSNTIIAITHVEYKPEIKKAVEYIISEFKKLKKVNRPLLILTDDGYKPISMFGSSVISLPVELPDMNLSQRIWEFFQKEIVGEELIDSKEVASKMLLTVGQIKGIVKRINCNQDDVRKDKNLVYKYCYETLDDGRFDGIKRVNIRERLEDLILPESQKDVIRHICGHVTHRMKVMGAWNLREHFTYGTGVSALFVGPPGTGKTMAARVVAGMLGLELFQIDLSQVVDKYVGETEKKLEEIFKKASQSNMVLFFDEADAIIGKRSEVKEAQDKYANVEVAFLLQRLEQYDGIVLFASNFLQNIDPAFKRRMRFLVRFERPTEEEREAIWRSVIPKEMPVERLDFEYLKKNFDFSGAQIKNTVFNAAFFAAEENVPMGMAHIVNAALIEIKKEKVSNLREALGIYADLAIELEE